jgi:superfamily II DNA or RNA helicase
MDYHLSLNKKGYIIKKNYVDQKTLEKIKKELRVSPIVLKAYQEFVKPVEFEIYQESPNYLYVPRFYGIEQFGPPLKDYLPNGAPMNNNTKFIYDLLPHQINAYHKTLKTLKDTGGGVLQLACGLGKCLSLGTPVLMYDGTIKKVEDVAVGDQLMGDDSTPRNVMSLARGQDEMYEIHTPTGATWGCNQSHILSLKCSANHGKVLVKDAIYDIELSQFLKYQRLFQCCENPLRLYRVPILFPRKEIGLDPYMLGYWLGKSKYCVETQQASISTLDCGILDYFTDNLAKYDLILDQDKQNPTAFKIVLDTTAPSKHNYFTECLSLYNLLGHKHIPLDYKCNSPDVQLQILAGLVDSIGELVYSFFKIVTDCKDLVNDILFICRSLGFYAHYHKEQNYTCYIRGDRGEDLEKVPVLLRHHKFHQSNQINQLRWRDQKLTTSFSVQHVGRGDYYGFTIDGNRRFLLGDFTVTHNTALAIKLATDLGGKTLVVVNKECLMDQWIDSITKFTGGHARIGIIQQDKVEVTNKDFVVTMLHSLCKKNYPDTVFEDFAFSVVDEVHHISSEMFSKALPKITSKYMLGLSATPNRKDGLSHVFHKYIGDICHSERRSGSNRVLVKRFKLSSNSPMYETLYMSNGIKNTVGMVSNLSKYEARTSLILESIRILMKQDRKILLLSGRREHLESLYQLLDQSDITNIHGKKITFGYYWGNQGGNKKRHKQALDEAAKCDVVLGTVAISSEGLDIPDLNTEIIATPVTDVEQAVGRILRKFHDQLNPIVIDLVDNCGNFARQATTRAKFYKDEDYEIQDLRVPLGDNAQDLQPFLPEITNYLLNTNFKQKKYQIKDADDDDNNPNKLPNFGGCLLSNEEPESDTQTPKPIPKLTPKTNKTNKTINNIKGCCLLDDEEPINPIKTISGNANGLGLGSGCLL